MANVRFAMSFMVQCDFKESQNQSIILVGSKGVIKRVLCVRF